MENNSWMRCFTGLKASTKEKLAALRQSKNRKQNGENNNVDPVQLGIIEMHHPDTLDGCQKLDELGFSQHTVPLKTIDFDGSTIEDEITPQETINFSDCDDEELRVSKSNPC